MQVTKILPLDKKRSRVWLDEEFAFVLYKGELRRFNIREGGELNEKDYIEIVHTLLPKRAKLRAMNLLKSHTYSVKQLEDKLREGFYPEEIISEAIQYVSSYGYLDDLRLCEEYIRGHLADKSRMRISMDLKRKGISSETIREAFENCSEEGFIQDETEQVKNLLKKRRFDPSLCNDRKEFAKQFSYLASKGYSSETIRKALGEWDSF
ncbi:MAG: regulatory protein RecX [Lachnospiraceae bacterium]|nr:regulatory protein RecX [Lachnospiraceae bacterium]